MPDAATSVMEACLISSTGLRKVVDFQSVYFFSCCLRMEVMTSKLFHVRAETRVLAFYSYDKLAFFASRAMLSL